MWTMLRITGVDDLVVCLGDFNVHVGRYIDGFDGVHGRYVEFGRKNFALKMNYVCQYMVLGRGREVGDIQNLKKGDGD